METVRKWLQFIFAFLLNSYWLFPFSRNIYQGSLKAICSPGLNCFSCPAATFSCPIGSLQQLLMGAQSALEQGHYCVGLYVLGSMGVLGGIFGRMPCGWVCPFGLLQELIHKLPTNKRTIPYFLTYGKYVVLLLLVVLLPLLVTDGFGYGIPWFCKYMCPAGTLEAGITLIILQPALLSSIGFLFFNKLIILVFYSYFSVLSNRAFCRTSCPLGAFYSLFRRVSLIRLHFDSTRCIRCGECHRLCPMEVKFFETPDDPNCISCLACMNKACKYGAISLRIAGIPIMHSDSQ